MSTTKKISSWHIIQECSQRFQIKNGNWWADAIDWIGQGIQAIGYHTGFDKKDIEIDVNSYRARIPDEVDSIQEVWYNGIRLPLAINVLGTNTQVDLTQYTRVATPLEITELGKLTDLLQIQTAIYNQFPTQENLDAINNTLWKINQITENLKVAADPESVNTLWYYLENGYVKTNFCDGTIILKNANVIATDDDGYPMVIDTYKYRTALTWYIMTQWLLQGNVHPVVKYGDAEARWNDFMLQAQNEPKVMSIDEMNRFGAMWTSTKRDYTLTTLQGDL